MYFIIAAFQLTAYLLFSKPLIFFFRTRITYHSPESFRKGIILAPNHHSKLDSILILASLSPKQFMSLIPIYSLITVRYMDTLWKRIALSCFGCYPVKGTKQSYESLLQLLQLIDEKKTVLIFPEGRIIKKDEVSQASPGIGYAALKKNPSIMPVFVKGFNNVTLQSALMRRYHATVLFGEASMYRTQKKVNPVLVSKKILKKIYELDRIK